MTDHSTASVVGLLAGTLTTTSLVPQVVRTWRTRRAGDLSITMLVVFMAGVALWLTYGLMLRETPIIAANVTTLALLVALFVMRLRF